MYLIILNTIYTKYVKFQVKIDVIIFAWAGVSTRQQLVVTSVLVRPMMVPV